MRKLRWFLIPPLTIGALVGIAVATGLLCPHPFHWFYELGSLLSLHREPGPPDFETYGTTVHVTGIESFTLSPAVPQNEEFGVRLISIAADGTTEIETTDTSRRLTSTPGQPFASKEFGCKGLVLRTASSDTQTAIFDRWFCRTITQTTTK